MAELSNSVERSEFCRTNANVDSDDICERCRSIPWHEVPTREHKISTTPRKSGCRVCRWFAKFGCNYINVADRAESLYPYRTTKRLVVWQEKLVRDPWDIVVCDHTTQTALQSLTPPFISFSWVKNLLNRCMEHHAGCSLPRQDHDIPKLKVINCTTRQVVNAPANCEYVALSYVWGSAQSVNNDLASMQVLPRVLEQSIVVASKLGFKFLWIDRYCIDQGDEQQKNDQILQMSTIYRGAQITIIAAAGQDPTHGLPGVEPDRRSPAQNYHEAVGSVCLSALPRRILDGDVYFENIRNTVWASRAWTFQEAIFSRRRLLFTESQAIFSCNTSTRCEWGRELRNDHPSLVGLQWCGAQDPLRVGIPVRGACDTMEKYCVRKMTHDSDALNAIASTLNFIQRNDEYHIWGVPFRVCKLSSDERQKAISNCSNTEALLSVSNVKMIQIHLAWYHWEETQRRRQGFPSWSPLGWSPGDMNYLHPYQGCIFVHTPRGRESLSTNLQSAKVDPVGMAQHISLLLKTRSARVCKRTVSYGLGSDHGIALPLGQGFAYMSPINWDEHVEVEGELKIAMISSDYGFHFIILQAHDGYYERIGYSWLLPDTLKTWAENGFLWCLADEKINPILLSVYGELEPFDEERLIDAFGDINEEFWYGMDGFQEEYIILG